MGKGEEIKRDFKCFNLSFVVHHLEEIRDYKLAAEALHDKAVAPPDDPVGDADRHSRSENERIIRQVLDGRWRGSSNAKERNPLDEYQRNMIGQLVPSNR